MQKLCCVHTIQQPLPVRIIVTSLPTHISINSHPFPVGIVSGCFQHCSRCIIVLDIFHLFPFLDMTPLLSISTLCPSLLHPTSITIFHILLCIPLFFFPFDWVRPIYSKLFPSNSLFLVHAYLCSRFCSFNLAHKFLITYTSP